VRVAPSRVHDQNTRIFAHGFRERLRALLNNDVAPALLAWKRCVKGRTVGVLASLEGWDNNIVLQSGLALLALDRTTVDSEVTKVGEELLSSVLTLYELEELGSVVDKLETRMRFSAQAGRDPGGYY